MRTGTTKKVPTPTSMSVRHPEGFRCFAPQPGQASAFVLTWCPHSLHWVTATTGLRLLQSPPTTDTSNSTDSRVVVVLPHPSVTAREHRTLALEDRGRKGRRSRK